MATSPVTSAAINRMLREFHPLDRVGGGGGAVGDHTHPKESIPTVLVAAGNARDEVKNMADFVCDGEDDNAEIVAGFIELDGNNGRVLLSEGDFFIDEENGIGSGFGRHIQGVGATATILHNQTDGKADDRIISMSTQGLVSDLMIWTNQGTYKGVQLKSVYGQIRNITFAGNAKTGLEIDGGQEVITGLNFSAPNYTDSSILITRDSTSISDVIQINGQGDFLRIDGSTLLTTSLFNVHVAAGASLTNGIVVIAGSSTSWVVSGITIECLESAILVDATGSFRMAISGAALKGEYGIRTINNGEFNNLILDDVHIGASVLAIDAKVVKGSIDNVMTTGGVVIKQTQSSFLSVSNLNVDGSAADGVRFESLGGFSYVQNLRASHIYVDGAEFHGIVLDKVRNAVLHDCQVENVGDAASNTYDGILVTGDSEDVMLHHNKVHALPATRYGIHIQSGDRAMVVGNDLGLEAGYGTAPLNDGAAGTILSYPDDAVYGDNFVTDAAELLVQTIVDGVGVTEEVELGFQVVAEDVGVTDTITHSAPVVERTISEAVGATDEVQSIETKANTDAVGVTDTVTPVLT